MDPDPAMLDLPNLWLQLGGVRGPSSFRGLERSALSLKCSSKWEWTSFLAGSKKFARHKHCFETDFFERLPCNLVTLGPGPGWNPSLPGSHRTGRPFLDSNQWDGLTGFELVKAGNRCAFLVDNKK